MKLKWQKKRLICIQKRILELKKNDKLVKEWNSDTYRDALGEFGELAQITEGVDVFDINNRKFGTIKYQNYIAREVNMTVHRLDQSGYKSVLNTQKNKYDRIATKKIKNNWTVL
jgi:hypothetical protein